MRKNVLIKSFCALCIAIITSCSSDDADKDTTPDEKSILIKKITETIYYSNGSETSTSDFVYEKNVLKSVTSSSGFKSEFEYDGDKITKVNYYRDGVASNFTTFNYNGNFLISTVLGSNEDEKTEYFYNNGILASIKSGYVDNDTYVVQSEVSYSYDNSNNVAQAIIKSYFFGSETVVKEKYFYDTKNHPMKFMNKYYRFVFDIEGFDGKTTNNVISRESYYPVTVETPNYFTYDIVYNNDNFPIEIKKISKANNFILSKTIIEYQ